VDDALVPTGNTIQPALEITRYPMATTLVAPFKMDGDGVLTAIPCPGPDSKVSVLCTATDTTTTTVVVFTFCTTPTTLVVLFKMDGDGVGSAVKSVITALVATVLREDIMITLEVVNTSLHTTVNS